MDYENKLLEGKTAVITGGSSGIGRGISLKFAQHGADIIIGDIRENPREGGRPTHIKIEEETKRNAQFIECDVGNPKQIKRLMEKTENFGGLDVLVNNAAIAQLDDFDITEEKFDRFFDVNVKGCFFTSKLASEKMDKGSIINISSVEALEGTGQRVVYGSTRGAIRQMTFSLADRLSPDIRVNVIYPGLIETQMVKEDVPIFGNEEIVQQIKNMIPLDRTGVPEDIAGPTLFLASDLSSYVSGAEILVDGGMTNTF